MRKSKINKSIQGHVDLNQAKLEGNKKARPSVNTSNRINQKTNKINQKHTADKPAMPIVNKTDKKIKPIDNVREVKNASRFNVFNRDENGKILLTRRSFLYGALGAGALMGVSAGVKFGVDKINKSKSSFNTLTVPKANVITSENLAESDNLLSVKKEIILPYGSLAWANSSDIITCLIPNDTAKPLATVNVINSNTGKQTCILDNCVGQNQGYEIYDARANDNGIIWTEVNILQGEWRIFASNFDNSYNINAVMLDKGNNLWETPTIAITKNCVYWQVLPKATESKSSILSSLKKSNLNKLVDNKKYTSDATTDKDVVDNPNTIFTSNGRMSSPVNAYNNGVVITPRANSNAIHYQLTYIDENDDVVDDLVLPQNMKPLEANYGKTGFNFAFDAIYNYGDGISNLGTYTPIDKNDDDYSQLKWLNFTRVPSSSPAWYDNLFIIRSTMAIVAINLESQTYCVLDRPNASDDYGDFLASSGSCNNIVSFANIYDQPISGSDKKYCSLRIWA